METSNKSLDRVRLGISPLSWTNDVLHDLGDEIPLEQCLREASEIGYEGVELGRKFPRDPAGVAAKACRIWPSVGSGVVFGIPCRPVIGRRMGGGGRSYSAFSRDVVTSILVYGRSGKMPGNSDLNLPLSRSPELKSIDLPAYAKKVKVFSAAR